MMIEQPLAHDDIVDHARLQEGLKTPICLDESIHSAEDARKALDLGSGRIINIKVSRVGGLDEAKKIHDLCQARGVPVWCGGMHEYGIGRAANVAISTLPASACPATSRARTSTTPKTSSIRRFSRPAAPSPRPMVRVSAGSRTRRAWRSSSSVSTTLSASSQGKRVSLIEALRTRRRASNRRATTRPPAMRWRVISRERFSAAGGDVRSPRRTRPAATTSKRDSQTGQAEAGARPLPLRHGLAARHAGERVRFRCEDDKAYGPGIFDMKASLVMVEELVRAATTAPAARGPVTSDEEVGQPDVARADRATRERGRVRAGARAAAGPGRLKMRRKGVGRFTVEVMGRAAHAGLEPEKGVSATVELAHQIVRVHALNDPERGTTVNVGLVSGGTKTQRRPGRGRRRARRAGLDGCRGGSGRAPSFGGLTPVLPGAVVRGDGALNRPPMELSDAQLALFDAGARDRRRHRASS